MNTKSKILIVDDAELNRSVLADILDEKYEIIEAENGLEAIVQIEKNKHELSLVLLDIMMPKVDGFEVLAAVMPVQVVTEEYLADLSDFQALCTEQFYLERSRAAADEGAEDAEAEKTMEQIGMEEAAGGEG